MSSAKLINDEINDIHCQMSILVYIPLKLTIVIFQESVNVERLDIGGNWIMPEGGRAISKLLEENEYITEMVRTATFCHYILTCYFRLYSVAVSLFPFLICPSLFFLYIYVLSPKQSCIFFIVYHEIRWCTLSRYASFAITHTACLFSLAVNHSNSVSFSSFQ